MVKRGMLTVTLAVVGTVLVWFPILTPIVFGLMRLVRTQRFLFDYLMPAELFPVTLIGGALLVLASVRARSRRAHIGWSLGLAAALLTGGQALAVATGLASGEREPAGIWFALVVATIAGFILAVVALGIGGILLLRDLWGPARSSPEADL
jgi:hypothetical protein